MAKKMVKEKTISITIELPDYILLEAMILAHKEDMTFNEWCNKVLKEMIKEKEKEVKKK
jgi:hypothetical protein